MAEGSGSRRAFTVLCLLLQLEFINGNGIELFGVVNKDITLHPSSDTVFKEITWKKGRNKVVEWYEGSSLYEEFPPFKGRVSLNATTGALTIMNLTLSDEDNYEIESSDLKAVFFLLVLERLPPPILSCSTFDEDIEIHCAVPQNYNTHRNRIEYSWNCSSPKCRNLLETKISFKKEDNLSQEVKCIVKNPVSTMHSSMTLETCVPKHYYLRTRLPLIAVIPVSSLIVYLVYKIGIPLCCRKDSTNSS